MIKHCRDWFYDTSNEYFNNMKVDIEKRLSCTAYDKFTNWLDFAEEMVTNKVNNNDINKINNNNNNNNDNNNTNTNNNKNDNNDSNVNNNNSNNDNNNLVNQLKQDYVMFPTPLKRRIIILVCFV